MRPLSDAGVLDAVLTAARDNDENAFRVLWEELNPKLLRYLRALGHSGCDDLAAETWAQALAGLKKFGGDFDAFRGWMFTIARHRGVDAARAATTSRRWPSIYHGGEAVAPSAEDVVLAHVSTAEALELVRTLPRDQAEAVALRFIADLDVRTAARILGKSEAAIRVNTHRGLRALSERLGSAAGEAVV